MPAFLETTGIRQIRTAYRSPWQNPYVERVIGTLRGELLDHIIPLDEWHLHRFLSDYVDKYYHPVRTHGSLDHKPPDFDQSAAAARQELSPNDDLDSEPILGGLYTNYRAKAA